MTIKLNKALASKKILNKRGSPQTTAVMLLEEIVSQYQLELITDPDNKSQQSLSSSLKEGWKVNYQYFEEKFGYGHYKTRYAFRALEQHNLIKRERLLKPYQHAVSQGGSEIYIILNLANIKNFLDL
jgi:hypothetical protein